MRCIALIEGCPDCDREDECNQKREHQCGDPHSGWFTLCEVERDLRAKSEEFHRLRHEPIRCPECQEVLDDRRGTDSTRVRACRAGCCTEWFCGACGAVQASAGPIDCPSCGHLAHTRRLSRMRRRYRARRRYW